VSKEFQIRDGNLIASFDLENEDGDIDVCKLLKVSHGVADEIGMFVDYVAINKIIKDQSKQIADLETQLADLQEEQIAEMQEHQEAMELADKTITNLVEDNHASQEWYKKQLAEKDEQLEYFSKRDEEQEKQLEKQAEFHRKSVLELKQQLADTETQNKRVLEKLELIVSANQELEQKLAEKEKQIEKINIKCYTLESYNNFLNNQCKKLIKENKQLKEGK
jgi:DNA repair exonuclease SbcCD ATPase subunit